MPRQFKSQWDFGELFERQAATQPQKIYTVSELTQRISSILETEFPEVWVRGEISGLKLHQASGHIYFDLKDAGSRIRCVIFRDQEGLDREFLKDGQQLVIRGNLTVFSQKGEYRLIVRAVVFEGLGKLMLEMERLKRKLAAEGLLDESRKRAIPRFPTRIGLVTSPSGAAIRDVLRIIRNSPFGLEIILAPCRVQGLGAATEIANAIHLLNRWHMEMIEHAARMPEEIRPSKPGLDLIIVTRGGGSIEDLWAFNKEIVARAIAASKVPVISAVGHESDWTISDLVADLRAPTPTAAANTIVNSYLEAKQSVIALAQRITNRVYQLTEGLGKDLRNLQLQLSSLTPRRLAETYAQLLDDATDQLTKAVQSAIQEQATELLRIQSRLHIHQPSKELQLRQERVNHFQTRLLQLVETHRQKKQTDLNNLESKLQLLGPMQTIGRGYSITFDAVTGKIVRSVSELQAGQLIKTQFKDGHAFSRVVSFDSDEGNTKPDAVGP